MAILPQRLNKQASGHLRATAQGVSVNESRQCTAETELCTISTPNAGLTGLENGQLTKASIFYWLRVSAVSPLPPQLVRVGKL